MFFFIPSQHLHELLERQANMCQRWEEGIPEVRMQLPERHLQVGQGVQVRREKQTVVHTTFSPSTG